MTTGGLTLKIYIEPIITLSYHYVWESLYQLSQIRRTLQVPIQAGSCRNEALCLNSTFTSH